MNRFLGIDNIESKLDSLNEFVFEESDSHKTYYRKNGNTILNLYSSIRYRDYSSFDDIDNQIQSKIQQTRFITEYAISARKGIYVYHAIEGDRPGADYPVGFVGKTNMGDYFRFLSPTDFAYTKDFPIELRENIARSELIEFSDLEIIETHELNTVFSCRCD